MATFGGESRVPMNDHQAKRRVHRWQADFARLFADWPAMMGALLENAEAIAASIAKAQAPEEVQNVKALLILLLHDAAADAIQIRTRPGLRGLLPKRFRKSGF